MTKGNRVFRVVHAPFDVGGNSYYLAQAERGLGFDARTLVYFKQWFGYPSDKSLEIAPGEDPTRRLGWWQALAGIALRGDVLHFNFGSSFLTDVTRKRVYADLPFWRRLGIATFVTYQGCDSRISRHCLDTFTTNACQNCRSREFCAQSYDTFKRECLLQAGRHFDGIFALNPDLLHNIPGGRFLPYSNCDLDAWRPPQGYDWHHAGPVRIVHAPTWRELKGTDYIIQAVDELRHEGENVELVLVENVPHDQVRRLYETADLLVDQLLVGWYGGLAVELMALGKPVVAYLREADLCFLPPAMRADLPVISAERGTLKEVLRPLIRNADLRRRLGERARQFAETWHHPRAVAKITTGAYRQALGRRPPLQTMRARIRVVERIARPVVADWASLYKAFSPVRQWLCRKAALGQRTVTFLTGWLGRGALTTRLTRLLLLFMLPLVRLRGALRLWLGRPASVWGTTPIVTLPRLARGDRLLGFRSETVVFTTYYITSDFDRVLRGKVEWLAQRAPALLPVYYRLAFLRALWKYDVFHYFFDQGFLEREGRFGIKPEELRWLKLAGKRVYLYAYGADVRTRNETLKLGKFNCCMHCDKVGVHCLCNDEEGARKQALYRRSATALLSLGDMMAYVPGARNLYYWPFDVEKFPYVGVSWDGRRPLRILHVPNHEWAKGSRYLKQAVESLQARGVAVELIQATQKSNQEILRLMGEVDIIADQFIIGWHGYTALEALALGKVVLCYIREPQMLLHAEECPIVSANPDNLDDVLADLTHWRPERLASLGRQGRNYVERHFSIPAMAGRLGQLYLETGAFPAPTARRIKEHAAALAMAPSSGEQEQRLAA